MGSVVAGEPHRHFHLQSLATMEEGLPEKHSRASSLGRHVGRESLQPHVKDNIYNKTLTWLRNLKPWTKHGSPITANGDKDSLNYNNSAPGRNIRSSKSDRNLAYHLKNCSIDNEDLAARLARSSSGYSSSIKSQRVQNNFQGSLHSDLKYSERHIENTEYQPRYTSIVSSTSGHSLYRDNGFRPRESSFVDIYRNSKTSYEILYPQNYFHHHEPITHHNHTSQQYHDNHRQCQQHHRCSHQSVTARADKSQGADGYLIRSQSSNGLHSTISYLPRDSFPTRDNHKSQDCHNQPKNHFESSEDNTQPPMTTTQAAAAVSGSTVTRILREKLFGRAKSSISVNLDHGAKQEQQQQPAGRGISSSSSAHLVGAGESAAVKLRSKKCKPSSSDHVYVVNKEEKMARPRSCATLPHYVKLGKSLLSSFVFLFFYCVPFLLSSIFS